MSFFDDIDEEEVVSQDNSFETSDVTESLIGSVVYYDPVGFMFTAASSNGSTLIDANCISDWRTIMIGTIINVYEDETVDVLMCGFLMADALYLPIAYLRDEKKRFIRNYVNSIFKRYKSAFFKRIPAYNDLLKLDITLPTVSDILHIQEFYPQIFDSLRVCSDIKKFGEYMQRMKDGWIYVTHKHKTYLMKLTKDEDGKPQIIHPDVFSPGDFLCVFRHIKLNTSEEYNNLDAEMEKFNDSEFEANTDVEQLINTI